MRNSENATPLLGLALGIWFLYPPGVLQSLFVTSPPGSGQSAGGSYLSLPIQPIAGLLSLWPKVTSGGLHASTNRDENDKNFGWYSNLSSKVTTNEYYS